jgi:hypothetical protein
MKLLPLVLLELLLKCVKQILLNHKMHLVIDRFLGFYVLTPVV